MLSGLNVARGMLLLRTTGNTRLLMLVLLAVFAPSHAFSPTAASAEALQASYKIL
jgi:outer membrane lipoprotein-sorting protein